MLFVRLPSPSRRIALTMSLWLLAVPCSATERLLLGGIPEGLPGYAVTGDGSLRFSAEVRRQVFDCIENQLGFRITWQQLPTKRLMQELVEGRLDLGFPLGFTPERARLLLESAAAWDSPDIWISRRPVDIKDKQLRLAVRLGSPQQVDQTADGYEKVAAYFTYAELVKALNLEMADAVVIPSLVFEQQRGLWPPDVVTTPGRPRGVGFYLPPQDPKRLAAPLDRAIERCRATLTGAKSASGR
jgi:ABC-type amino acid transport substrate-binding protein